MGAGTFEQFSKLDLAGLKPDLLYGRCVRPFPLMSRRCRKRSKRRGLEQWRHLMKVGGRVFTTSLQVFLSWMCIFCLFPTPRRIISVAVVQSHGGVGDGHVGVEGPKASLLGPRSHDHIVRIHAGSEGNLHALWGRFITTVSNVHRLSNIFFFLHVSPECWRTLLLNVLISCHKDCTLAKAASSSWYMSLAAQQQPRWRVKAQSQSHVSQLRGWLHLTGKWWEAAGWNDGNRSRRARIQMRLDRPLTCSIPQNLDGAGLRLHVK